MSDSPDHREPASAAIFDADDPLTPRRGLCPPQAEPPGQDPPRPLTVAVMAAFCERLAECGMVHRAAAEVGFSRNTLYRHRRNNPSFAAAWDSALVHARQRLADYLLERAFEGSFDFTYEGGELVGHRHYLDSRLGYAMLCRLDRAAEQRDGGGATPEDRDCEAFDRLVTAIRPTGDLPLSISVAAGAAAPGGG
ncbi:hypothetical protein GCM10022280_01830 [Sphingomonas swuensis]|uniref:TetR family transcriptional regulator n=1 Tax=Sphingomonas swuensis TaxID=977800 RepID=A0ABP7S9F7_9SPHN